MTSEFRTGKGDSYPALGRNSPKNHDSPANRGVGSREMGPFHRDSWHDPLSSQKTEERCRRCGVHTPACRQPARLEGTCGSCPHPRPCQHRDPSTGIQLGFCGIRATASQPLGRGRGRHRSPTHHQRLPLPPAPSRKHKTGREGETLRAQPGSKRAEKIWRWRGSAHSQASQHLVLIKHSRVRNEELLVSVEGVEGSKAGQTQSDGVTGNRVQSD